MKEIKFFVNDVACKTIDSNQTVSNLLEEAGFSVKHAVLVTPDGVEHRDPAEIVQVAEGEHLKVRSASNCQIIHYQVNGEDQTTITNPLTMGKILEQAGRPASIDINDVMDYYLEDLLTEKRYDRLDAEVILCNGDQFIAVHQGATPVACSH